MAIDTCLLCHDPDIWIYFSCTKVTSRGKQVETESVGFCQGCSIALRSAIDGAIETIDPDKATDSINQFFN